MEIVVLLIVLLPALFLSVGYNIIVTLYLVSDKKTRWFWQKKRKHEIVINEDHWYECAVCTQTWIGERSAEYSTCPGIHCYEDVPVHFMTRRRLQMIGYTPIGTRVGCNEDYEDLYDIGEAVPLPSASQVQIASMQQMREVRIAELEQELERKN